MRNNSVFSLPILFIFSAGLQLSFWMNPAWQFLKSKEKKMFFLYKTLLSLALWLEAFSVMCKIAILTNTMVFQEFALTKG